MIDRGGEAGEVGRLALGPSDALFEWWHRVRDGTLARSSFQTYVATMRPFLREDLERGCEETEVHTRHGVYRMGERSGRLNFRGRSLGQNGDARNRNSVA